MNLKQIVLNIFSDGSYWNVHGHVQNKVDEAYICIWFAVTPCVYLPGRVCS